MGKFDNMKDGFFQLTLNDDEDESYSTGPRQDEQHQVDKRVPEDAILSAIVEKTNGVFNVVEVLKQQTADDTVSTVQEKIAKYLASTES